jgi:hypothetical protein
MYEEIIKQYNKYHSPPQASDQFNHSMSLGQSPNLFRDNFAHVYKPRVINDNVEIGIMKYLDMGEPKKRIKRSL